MSAEAFRSGVGLVPRTAGLDQIVDDHEQPGTSVPPRALHPYPDPRTACG